MNALKVNLYGDDYNVKYLVCLGSLRNMVNSFYGERKGNELRTLYGIENDQKGQSYFKDVVLSNFLGKEGMEEYKDLKKPEYMYFNLKTLAYYCSYIQGIYNVLINYKKSNNEVLKQDFETLVTSYAEYFHNKVNSFDIKPNKKMAKSGLDKDSYALFFRYLGDSNDKVTNQEAEKAILNTFSANSSKELPFVLDLNYFRNFFGDKAYTSRYKVEMIKDTIDYCKYASEKFNSKEFETMNKRTEELLKDATTPKKQSVKNELNNNENANRESSLDDWDDRDDFIKEAKFEACNLEWDANIQQK